MFRFFAKFYEILFKNEFLLEALRLDQTKVEHSRSLQNLLRAVKFISSRAWCESMVAPRNEPVLLMASRIKSFF